MIKNYGIFIHIALFKSDVDIFLLYFCSIYGILKVLEEI